MIINGIDVRRYGATLLTAETKPPKMTANYEMMSKALLPTEYDTDIPLGSMTMTIYFRGKNRATLERTMSSFMQNFRSSEDSKENTKVFWLAMITKKRLKRKKEF